MKHLALALLAIGCSSEYHVAAEPDAGPPLVVVCAMTDGVKYLEEATEYWNDLGYSLVVGPADEQCSIRVWLGTVTEHNHANGRCVKYKDIPVSPDFRANITLDSVRWVNEPDEAKRAATVAHEIGHALDRKHYDGDPMMDFPLDSAAMAALIGDNE